MAFDPGKISEFPGLREWLVADNWQDDFDRPTLQRSRPYVSERMIKDLAVADEVSTGPCRAIRTNRRDRFHSLSDQGHFQALERAMENGGGLYLSCRGCMQTRRRDACPGFLQTRQRVGWR